MEKLSLVKMENISGGTQGSNANTATAYMCTLSVLLLFTGFLAPAAAAPGIGCALGLSQAF